MSQEPEPGFEIDGRRYAFPRSYRLCDPVLVREVTGLSWQEFVDALADEDRQGDPAVTIGVIAVAVWQSHPRWPRERVVRYLAELDISALSYEEPGEDDGPPAAPGESPAQTSGTSPGAPSDSPAASSSDPTPPSSGMR